MPKKKAKAKQRRYSAAFTADQSTTIVAKYKAGKTLDELAAQYKCSTSKVRKVLLASKVGMRPRGPKEDPSKAKAKTKKVKAKKAAKVKVRKATKNETKVLRKSIKEAQEGKLVDLGSFNKTAPKKGKRELTPEQRDAKNARDRERRAAKKSGLAKAISAVAEAQAAQ